MKTFSIYYSSNLDEVIRAVLNSLFYYYSFFFTKRFCTHQKHQKAQKCNQAKTQKRKNANE